MKLTKKKMSVKNIICFVFTTINIVLFFLEFSLINYIENSLSIINMDEIIFYLQAPIKQAGGNLIEDFIKKNCIWIFICCVILVAWFFCALLKKENKRRLFVYSFVISLFAFIILTEVAIISLDIPNYVSMCMKSSQFIEDHYVSSRDAQITFPKKKRNLVWIYMESMESTYISKEKGGAMKENFVPEMTQLAEENINFSENSQIGGATSSKGTDWTTGGLFAQTCGLPLLLNIGHGDSVEYKKFAPGAETLGDILKREGYYQEFMLGSDAVFGGRKSYFEQHGFNRIYDYNSAIKNTDIPKDYYVWWGYEDSKLYRFAKRELKKISEGNQPFALSLLTVDTHFVGGYVCDKCKRKHEDTYSDVLQCASRQVTDFVEWIQKQDFYENTTIIITGDHPTMDEGFILRYYDKSQPRKVYNCIINAPIQTKYDKNRKFNTFDLYPTAIASLGAQIKGERLGLGTNLFSGEKTLAERCGYTKIDEEFSKKSVFYNLNIW